MFERVVGLTQGITVDISGLTLSNTTIADNLAAGPFGYVGYGGGIRNYGSMTLLNSSSSG